MSVRGRACMTALVERVEAFFRCLCEPVRLLARATHASLHFEVIIMPSLPPLHKLSVQPRHPFKPTTATTTTTSLFTFSRPFPYPLSQHRRQHWLRSKGGRKSVGQRAVLLLRTLARPTAAMGTHPNHTTRIRERDRRRTVPSLLLLFLCLLQQVKASSTSELPPTPESVANATLHVNETLPLQQQEGEKKEEHDVRLEPGVAQDIAAEIVIPQIVQQELEQPASQEQKHQPPQKQQGLEGQQDELQDQERQEQAQNQQPSLEQQPPQQQEEQQRQPVVMAEEEEGSGSVAIDVPEQINEEDVKEEGVMEEKQNLDKEGDKDIGTEEEDEEDDDEHKAAERDSLEEIKLVIEAQAEEERRWAEDAALDEARAHAAEREAARQEAEEKQQTRRRAGDAHAGATSWGHAAGQGSSGSSGSSSSGTGAGSANASGSGSRGGAFASLSSSGSGGPFSRMGGLGRASNAGSSASSSSSSRRGRVPPTDEQAQAEMMSAAFGGGAGGAGTASFEDMMTQQERSMHGGNGEESATVRARLAAKLVLETDALLYGGQGGPGGGGMLGLEIGDEGLDEEEEGGVGEGKKAALVRDRTGKEIARILREGEKDEPNWYAVLGISRRASAQSVKDSFRRLVLLIHPDKTASRGAQEAFQLVQEAYESLSSPSERRAYDQYLVKLRAKRWKERIRPIKDKLDELSDYYEPVLERKGKIVLGAFLLWALVL